MPVMIDAHHHLWDLAAREHGWLLGAQSWATDDELAWLRRSFTLTDLVPLAAAAGVTGTVVIQTTAEPWLAGPARGAPRPARAGGSGPEL
jgi:predicted TIM-barrel fold metal-dependent hydrolase